MITSPARIDLPVTRFLRETEPTIVPTRSYSPTGYSPGISAVSPPRSAILFSLHALQSPETTLLNTAGSTFAVPT